MRVPHPATRATPSAILAAILVLAAVLRFDDLTQRGLVYWDEGKFALEGLRFEALLHKLVAPHASAVAGKSIGTAKPSHALLIAIVYALIGVHDYAPLLLNAAASVGQVLMVYVIARRLFDPWIALTAALLLAVSEYEVIYARSALSESDGCLFLLIGAYVWLARPHAPTVSPATNAAENVRARLTAGLLLGLAFTVNYRLIVYIGAAVIVDVLWTLRSAERTVAAKRLGFWCLGLLIAPTLWQCMDLAARLDHFVLFHSELTGKREWYVQQALFQLHQGRQSVVRFDPWLYVQWWLLREGWLPSILLLIGVGLALVRRTFALLTMTAMVVLPYAVYALAPFIVPRNLEAALPFASILAAVALVEIARCVRPARTAMMVGCAAAALVGAIGADRSFRLHTEQSGIARAAAYVQSHNQSRVLTSNEVMVFYFRGTGKHCNAPPFPGRPKRLSADRRAGYVYAVLDRFRSPLSLYVRKKGKRVARYDAAGSLSIGEDLVASENSHAPGFQSESDTVDVYRLQDLKLPPPGREHPGGCDRDVVT